MCYPCAVLESSNNTRERFTNLLEESKRSLVSHLAGDRDSRDGPNKRLAAAIRISPSRVGDFLDSGYSIHVVQRSQANDSLQLLPEARIRKTVAGFAASVHRTLSWLRVSRRLPEADKLTTEMVVKAYWPGELLAQFDRQSVSDGISDAEATTHDEINKFKKIDIEIWVVSYGPFDKTDDSDHEDFFSSFGRALIAGIDPIDSVVTIKKKPLTELLNLPAPDRRRGRAIAMGPFATLYRRFRGYKFATLPVIGIPLVGLVISDKGASRSGSSLTFRSIFNTRTTKIKRIVVADEIGHLVLCSMLPAHVRHDASTVEVLPGDDHRNIPDAILKGINSGPVIFLSDSVLAFQVYSSLSKEDVRIDVISQWCCEEKDFLNREFVYAPGIMLHDEDRDFAALINDSQQQIFKSHWRIEDELLEPLFRGLEGWLAALRVTESAIASWPDHAPIFLFPRFDVADYLCDVVPHEGTRAALIEKVCGWIECRSNVSVRKAALSKLFKISPSGGSHNGLGDKLGA
jgi:hypothetical protein